MSGLDTITRVEPPGGKHRLRTLPRDYVNSSQPVRSAPYRSVFPDALFTFCVGILLVAAGYARGREELPNGTALFWVGQILIFGVVIHRLLSEATRPWERDALVFVYAGAQSLIRWAYSPHGFTFSDELQHFRALNNVLESNHLFSHNHSLPISSRYPGLENVAAELAQVASLGPFPAGVVVASATHVMTAGCILLLFREISRSSRVASIGAVIYMLNPHASFFNTSFLYETLALPFTILAVLLAIQFASRKDGRWLRFYGLLGCVWMVVMTHHVSALATVAILAGVGLSTVIWRRTRHLTLPLLFCAMVSALVVTVWVLGVAPITIEYLGAPIQDLIASVATFLSFSTVPSLPGPPMPLIERIIGPLGILVTLVLMVVNVRGGKNLRPLELCWTWIALSLYVAASGIRVVVSNGSELSGRLLTYAAIFSALAVATVLARIASAQRTDREAGNGRLRHLGATFLSIVLLLSSIMTSLPAWYQRIPGGFWIEGFGGGIDSVGTSRAEFAAAYLRPGMRYVGDITSLTLLATIGKMDPVKDPGSIYYSDQLTPEDVAHVKSSSVAYVDIDMRMSQYVPIGGKYFPQDVKGGRVTEPLDLANLLKFDAIAGLSRIYDSGYARMFDLRGGRDAPYAR